MILQASKLLGMTPVQMKSAKFGGDHNTWLTPIQKLPGFTNNAVQVFKDVTDNSLAKMDKGEFAVLLKDSMLPESIQKEVKSVRRRMKNRISARLHSQKQSNQMRQLCQDLRDKHLKLETEYARVVQIVSKIANQRNALATKLEGLTGFVKGLPAREDGHTGEAIAKTKEVAPLCFTAQCAVEKMKNDYDIEKIQRVYATLKLYYEYRAPSFHNGLQEKSGFEMCFDIGSRHLRCWGQNTSRIQNKEVYAPLNLQVRAADADERII